ncbi:OmpA family protein [Nocardiopsis sp. Huas11]|uniref:OmpA family protein n=1 Tax=Nocardiopsis sp. Huas11 TaxID=2183912 RepID=UPI0013153C50|nr:OmpA family protein [Nocardiopsis sp. Huas11]
MVTVALLVGPAWLASWLGWPLGEHTTWTWFRQYLRGGTIPDEVVIAALVVALWALWAAHLVVVALDIIALLRGLVPRVGLVRLMWVLIAGGATATSTHTAAVAAQTHTVAEAPAQPAPQSEHTPEQPSEDQESSVIDRTRNLSGFDFDSNELTPEMKESLEPTIANISDFGLPEAPVVVTGHTDPVGDPVYNRALSEQRAQAVADYLTEHLDGVEFEIQGAGSSQAPDNPRASYGEYRRVEVSYTLQRPTAPQATTEPEAAQAPDTEPAPDQAQLDVDTAGESDPGPDAVLVGTAAGMVGAAVGYAAGRRHGPTRRKQPTPQAHAPEREHEEDPASDTTEKPEPDAGELLREDPHGIARGVIDEDGYVLVADTVRVNGQHGLAFVGAHAPSVLAAVVTDHLPGPVIATRAVLAALGGAETMPPGVRVVADIPQARIAVEAELLTAARRHVDEEDGSRSDEQAVAAGPLLVVGDVSDFDTFQGSPQPLTTTPKVVVCVHGELDHAGTKLDCGIDSRVRAVSAHTEASREGRALRRHGRTRPGESAEADESQRQLQPEQTLAESQGSTEFPPTPATPCPGEDSSTPRVRMRLFSKQLVVEVDGREVAGLRTVARTLLAYLAVHPQGATAEEIAKECFAAVDSTSAASARKNALTSVRSSLRGALEDPEHPVIMNSNSRYALDPLLFAVDLWDFSAAYEKVPELQGQARVEVWKEVVRLHSEPLLGGSDELWVEPIRKSCSRVVVDSLVGIAENASEEEAKVRLLERACKFDEFNEPLYQRIMGIHISLGRPEMAHQVYGLLQEKLALIGEKPNGESRAILESRAQLAG